MKPIDKLKQFNKKLRLRQRMLIVYLVGCILPFLLCYGYMYYASSQNLIRQRIESENEKLAIEADDIMQAMDLAMELSTRLYFEPTSGKLILTQYFGENNLEVDYRNFGELADYVEDYYRDISSVVVYLHPEIEGDRRLIDNRHFKLITETNMQKEWYVHTVQSMGQPRWSYWTNTQTGQISLRLSRVLYDNKGNSIGVLSIALKPYVTETYIDEQEYYALLVLNEKDIVHANVKLTGDELASVMHSIKRKNFDGWIQFKDTRSVAFATKITQRYCPQDIYYLITIKPYHAVVAFASKNVIISLLPMLIGIMIMIIAIFFLARWFNKRMEALAKAMHRVAEGEREVSGEMIGDAQDEIYELYEDLNQMILEMQTLSENAAKERIQKEQLYSRQKDVEFKMLATQINPHFLYNTLENLRMLGVMNHVKEVEEISTNLTKILRGSLTVGQDLKTLKWEMDIIRCYITIQNYRFSDRISAQITYDESIGEKYMVIPFVVQPFVENAYVHALEDVEENGLITIGVSVDEAKQVLYIEVTDNGCGMSKEQLLEMTKYINDFEKLDRTHIGVCNVNQRIKLRFGESYGVDFSSKENEGTRVKLSMPLIENT